MPPSQTLTRGSFKTVAYLLMWTKLSSTDLMAFLLEEPLGSRRRRRGLETFGQKDLDKARAS